MFQCIHVCNMIDKTNTRDERKYMKYISNISDVLIKFNINLSTNQRTPQSEEKVENTKQQRII